MITSDTIQVACPHAQNLSSRDELLAAFIGVLDSGWYVLGSEVESFEQEFAHHIGVSGCAAVNSCTDALTLTLQGIGISIGDEVVTSAHTAIPTAVAIERAGAKVVFADIDPRSRCISADSIVRMLSKKTKAVIPVHIFGQPADVLAINDLARRYDFCVIEDCAQGLGASIGSKSVGAFGKAGAFSFYPTKNLGALGDGGAVVSNDLELISKIRSLRQYGFSKDRECIQLGYNSRLDEVQAAFLRVKLKLVESANLRRREIARRYSAVCDGEHVVAPCEMENCTSAMHLYVINCKERDKFRDFALSNGIETALHYQLPVHRHKYFRHCRRDGTLQNTEDLYGAMVTLPLYPELSDSQVERVENVLREWIHGKKWEK